MNIEIMDKRLEFDLYGISGDVANMDFAGTGKKLMEGMWKHIQVKDLSHKGINFWVYYSMDRMFTGVELENGTANGRGLEHKPVSLDKYAYYAHVGPYDKLGDVHRGMEAEMAARGLEEIGPRVEKYGHWNDDQTKLETEVFIGLK